VIKKTAGKLASPHLKSDADGQVIYESLRERIFQGGAAPGTRLPTERALATHFAAARNTVRNTMKRLEGEGLIVRHVGRGTFVAKKDSGQAQTNGKPHYGLNELLEARLLFEPHLAELVAERATDEELRSLSKHLDAMRAAQTWTEFKEAKYALHLAMIRASKNRFMVDIFEQIIASRRAVSWDRSDSHGLPVGVLVEAAVSDNTEIVEALQKRNAARARDLVRTNLLRTLVFVGVT
jgi:GntR family transcriptional regulator, transcriptional repressor for pyruvate dehydrogenase complex